MANQTELQGAHLQLFWWVFAVRGAIALAFAALLYLAFNLFGATFFDPIMLVYLSLLLGFYLAVCGIVLFVASFFAAEHQLNVWRNPGQPMVNAPLIWEIDSHPALAGTKLIAEAWDEGGLYQVGALARTSEKSGMVSSGSIQR